MSKPTKPTPPREPKPPERVYREIYEGSICTNDMSLTRILEEVRKASEGTFPGADDREVERRKAGMPSFDDITFENEHDYDNDVTLKCVWPAAIIVTRSDEAFANLVAKHEADMVAYRTKLAAYEAALAQYEVDLAAWEAAKVADAVAKRRAQYEALKGEFEEGKS